MDASRDSRSLYSFFHFLFHLVFVFGARLPPSLCWCARNDKLSAFENHFMFMPVLAYAATQLETQLVVQLIGHVYMGISIHAQHYVWLREMTSLLRAAGWYQLQPTQLMHEMSLPFFQSTERFSKRALHKIWTNCENETDSLIVLLSDSPLETFKIYFSQTSFVSVSDEYLFFHSYRIVSQSVKIWRGNEECIAYGIGFSIKKINYVKEI